MAHRKGKPIIRKKKPPRSPVAKQTEVIVKDKDSPKEVGTADTLLIEVATYPGYNPRSPTSLPHGLDAHEQMKRVISAQTKLSTKLEVYRHAWSELFYLAPSQAIFLDYFWWFFLHKYQTNQRAIQDLLFTRISKNYVKMICEPGDLKTKDSFFKMYADLIAQCVYSAVIFAYPNSWISFDEDFKSGLCLYITLWQVGTKPLPNSWIKWELRLLEPIDLPKCKANEEDKIGVKSAGSFDFDMLLKEARRKAAAEEYQRKLNKRFSIMEPKAGTLHPKEHSIDFKKRAARRRSLGALTPDSDRLGVTTDQPTDLEQRASKLQLLLVPSEPPSRSSSPTSPRSRPVSPLGQEKRKEERQSSRHMSLSPSTAPSRQLQLRRRKSSSPKPPVEPRKDFSPKQNAELKRGSPRPSLYPGRGRRSAEVSKAGRQHSLDPRRETPPIPSAESSSPKGTSPQPNAGVREVSSPQPNAEGRGSSPNPTRNSSIPRRSAHLRGTRSSSATEAKVTTPSEQCSRHAREQSARISTTSAVSDHTHRPSTSAVGTPLVPIRKGRYDEMKKTASSFKKQEKSATLKGPEFQHVVFNVYGHSPLVRHYMEQMSLLQANEKEIVVGRTEITEEPPPDAVCFKDILTQSKVATESNREQFHRHYKQQMRSIVSANKRRVATRKLHEHNVKLMLAHQKDAQKLREDLGHSDFRSRIESNKAPATSAIRKSQKAGVNPSTQ